MFILLLKLAILVGLPLVEVLVYPVGPLIFPSLSSDYFLLSLINCAFVALLSFARSTQSIRLQKQSIPNITLYYKKSQYYFVLQSLHKFASTTVNYKACTNHFPILLCTNYKACTKHYSTHNKLLHTTSFYTQQAFTHNFFFHREAFIHNKFSHTASVYT